MASDQKCTLPVKILFASSVVAIIVGIILIIVAQVTAEKAADIDFYAKSSMNPSVSLDPSKPGKTLLIKESEYGNCEEIFKKTNISKPASLLNSCNVVQVEWEKDNDPPLRELGHTILPGGSPAKDYQIECPSPVWVIDYGKEFEAAVGGFFAALGLVVAGVVILIIGLIVACVGCCCMCMEQKPQYSEGQPPEVVGAQVK
jgi:hypothetical protein